MAKPSRRKGFDFLHVLEGGKAGQDSGTDAPRKTQRVVKQADRKPASKAKRTSTPKRKPPPNKASPKHRQRQGRSGRTANRLLKPIQGLGKVLRGLAYPFIRMGKIRSRIALSYLIIIGFVVSGALLAYGSHLLIERRSAQSIARLLEIKKNLMTIANSAAVPAPVLENPWSWKDIRIQPGHQHRYAIVMEGASDVGCEKIINATLPHFPVITVNGLRVSDNQQIRRTCSASMNTLTFVVTAHR